MFVRHPRLLALTIFRRDRFSLSRKDGLMCKEKLSRPVAVRTRGDHSLSSARRTQQVRASLYRPVNDSEAPRPESQK
jgi:hypothetical protein